MKISHSAKDKYHNCGYEYFLHYYRKLRPTEEKSSFKFGDAVDAGLNTLLETRDLEKAKSAFNDKWNGYRNLVLKYTKADVEEHLLKSLPEKIESDQQAGWFSLREKGLIILEEYNDQIMPRIKKVIKVQIDEKLHNDEGDELVIKTDFICEWEDGRIILFDNKTSSVKYEADSVKTSPQLAIYFEALRDEYKIDACGYIVIPKKTNIKKKPRVLISVIVDDILDETIADTYESFQSALRGIKAADFTKNTDNCINKFGKCPYYNYCHEGSLEGLAEKEDKNG